MLKAKGFYAKRFIAIILVVVLCCFSLNAGAVNSSQNSLSSEEKISDTLYSEFERIEDEGIDVSNEKIPVWIWYEDINQEQVDRLTEVRTGLTKENVTVNFELPSVSLLNSLENNELGSQEQQKKIAKIMSFADDQSYLA
ncbi:MAG: hypothetical protein ACI4I4_01555, partial [Acutalibacteraceae bacterium]